MPVLMQCARNYTLRTRSGFTIRFPANTPVQVPDPVVSEAMAVNILPVDPDSYKRGPSDVYQAKVPINGALKDALALNAIYALVTENEAVNFDGGGKPKVGALNQITGLSLSADERNEYWDKYRQLKSEGQDLPTHPALNMVLEVQNVNTPREAREYAQQLKILDEDFSAQPLRVQKQMLLNAAVTHTG